MRSFISVVLTTCLALAFLLSGCVKSGDKTSGKETSAGQLAPAHTVSTTTSPETEVKASSGTVPPTAVPPGNLPPATPSPTPSPASPEEQTKATLEPKAVQTAAPPQPKSEPAPEAPQSGKQAKPAEKPSSEATGKTPAAAKQTAQGPQALAVVGDSLAEGIGVTMAQRVGHHYSGLTCLPLGKVSTGLINKRFFDWDKRLSEVVAKEKPQAIVIMMGGNDANNSIGGKAPGSPEWDEAYRQKAADFLAIATKTGAKVLWVGLPAMRDAAYNKRVQAVNAAAKAACAKASGCSYLESSALFTDASGNFVPAKTVNGKKVSLRAKDGVHMTMNGYDLQCKQILEKLSGDGILPAAKQEP